MTFDEMKAEVLRLTIVVKKDTLENSLYLGELYRKFSHLKLFDWQRAVSLIVDRHKSAKAPAVADFAKAVNEGSKQPALPPEERKVQPLTAQEKREHHERLLGEASAMTPKEARRVIEFLQDWNRPEPFPDDVYTVLMERAGQEPDAPAPSLEVPPEPPIPTDCPAPDEPPPPVEALTPPAGEDFSDAPFPEES